MSKNALFLVPPDHPVLHTQAQEVGLASCTAVSGTLGHTERWSVPEDIITLAHNMISCMRSNGGIGLAAPQVGYGVRLIIVCDAQGTPKPYINPKVMHQQGEVLSREGCLSLPSQTCYVKRAQHVVIEAVDLEGYKVCKSCEGLEAICFQHEIDHLDGILMTDRKTMSFA